MMIKIYFLVNTVPLYFCFVMTSVTQNQAAVALDLSIVRYSRVWEDHALLLGGLKVAPTDVVLSIASSGDNVLNILLAGAKKVIAFDMSPAQIAFCHLKIAAARSLTLHADFVWFLGLVEARGNGGGGVGMDSGSNAEDGGSGGGSGARMQVYREVIRPVLMAAGNDNGIKHNGHNSAAGGGGGGGGGSGSSGGEAAAYWDERASLINAGIAKCGRLYQYFKQYRDGGARPPQEMVENIRQAGTLEARAAAFDAAFPLGGEAELAFKAFFGRENQAKHGRSDAQMRYVEEKENGEEEEEEEASSSRRRHRPAGIGAQSVADWLFSRFKEEALRPRSDSRGGNPYLDLLFYDDEVVDLDAKGAVPYLRPGNYGRLRELLAGGGSSTTTTTVELRMTTLEALCDELPAGSVNGFNLSDIFEYMDPDACDAVFRGLHRLAAPGARIAYWNLYLDRQPSPALSPGMWAPVLEADALYPGRHFAYSAFRVDERREASLL